MRHVRVLIPFRSRSIVHTNSASALVHIIFNHTEWNAIDTGTKDPTYGQVTSTYDPRVFQFGGKLMF